MSRTRSLEAFATAQKFMPGGVNSPVRSFRNVDTTRLSPKVKAVIFLMSTAMNTSITFSAGDL